MAIVASKGKTNFEPVGEGVHMATCIAVVDLGTQTVSWQGIDKTQRKVALTWEIPEERIDTDDGPMPRVITRTYTLSLSEKSALRPHLESWRGKAFTDAELEAFDLANILGKGCQISVLHDAKDGRVYANVNNVMALPKGMKGTDPIHNLVYFDLTDPNCLELYDDLPEFLKNKIVLSPEYQQLLAERESEVCGDDLPF